MTRLLQSPNAPILRRVGERKKMQDNLRREVLRQLTAGKSKAEIVAALSLHPALFDRLIEGDVIRLFQFQNLSPHQSLAR